MDSGGAAALAGLIESESRDSGRRAQSLYCALSKTSFLPMGRPAHHRNGAIKRLRPTALLKDWRLLQVHLQKGTFPRSASSSSESESRGSGRRAQSLYCALSKTSFRRWNRPAHHSLVDGVTGRRCQASRSLATALFGGALRSRLAWQRG